MNIEENSKFWENYQKQAWTTCLPSCRNFEYLALGLVNEAGEVAGKIKKKIRGDYEGLDTQFVQDVKGEIGDCLWYLFGLFTMGGINFEIIDTPDDTKAGMDTLKLIHTLCPSSLVLCRQAGDIGYIASSTPVAYWGATATFSDAVQSVCSHLSDIAVVLGFTLEEAAEYNLAKLAKRYATNKIIGSGDNR